VRGKVGNTRWSIAALIGVGGIVNIFDRTNMSVAAASLIHEFDLTKVQMGVILSAFAWSYALLQIPIGVLLDRIGVKWIMRTATLLWSISTFMTAIVSGMGLIILSRLILGAAEAPMFPSASKATGYWFPVRERGLATTMFDASVRFSNVIGVPVVAWAVMQWGWRGGFWLTAILSLFYAILYWIFYRDPKESQFLSEAERQYITEGGAQVDGEASDGVIRNLDFFLHQRKIWGLSIGYAAYSYSFYLFITWLPGYLETQMHMTVIKSGLYTVIPWIFATISDVLIAGWLVDRLIAKGYEGSKVRKSLLVAGMIMGLVVAGAAFTNNPQIAITCITISLSGLSFSAGVAWSIPSLISSKGTVGTISSIMNFCGNIMGICAPIVTGFIASGTGSFTMGFLVAVIVLTIGILCYTLVLGRIEQIKTPYKNDVPYKDDGVNVTVG
jgi:ACS family D-galactonate transporter-like MFS transporter